MTNKHYCWIAFGLGLAAGFFILNQSSYIGAGGSLENTAGRAYSAGADLLG